MKAIGGYFELENEGIGVFPHKNGILLNTGRNALEYILRSIPSIKGIYLPYYTCEVVLEPIKKLNIPFTYYHTNDCFEIAEDINLEEDQYIIVNNYFGIKDSYIDTLLSKFGDHLIVDCAQALFAPILPEIKMFYSIRKFIGVPDGGVAYGVSKGKEKWHGIDESYDRLDHLKIRKKQGAEAGFGKYQENEAKLNNQPILRMSTYTRFASRNIDYNSIIAKRRANYQYLDKALKKKNNLSLPDINSFACPMVYPFVEYVDKDLRKELISKKVFVARYWPNVVPYRDYNKEVDLAYRIIPLPIDQRYGKKDMDIIIKTIIQ